MRALDTIPPGEEIFISYIGSKCAYSKTRRSRQATLLAGYHFTCTCSVCSLSEAESKRSDTRRWNMYDELSEIINSEIACKMQWFVDGV